MVILPYCTEGFMNPKEVLNECGQQGWVPLVVFDHEEDGESFIVVPSFSSEFTCKKFLDRNFPKNWCKGGFSPIPEDLCNMRDNLGWRTLELSFPRKMKDIVEFRIEIYEMVGEFEAKVLPIPKKR